MRYLLVGLVFCMCLMGASSVYDFTLNSIDGQPAPLAAYKGKVLLLVNVASKCGFTPQYKSLEALYEKYKDTIIEIFQRVGLSLNPNGSKDHKLRIKGLNGIKVGDYTYKILDIDNNFGGLTTSDITNIKAI